MATKKRHIETLVLSDIHLGTYGCHAKELLNYLKSINPDRIILNGDIIDIWQFKKRYWPKSHMKIVKHVFHWLSKGKEIYYITGNHDEMLRKFEGFELGKLKIVNKLTTKINGKTAWFFHGDVFDVTMKSSKWLAKLGGKGYDLLIIINRFANHCLNLLGRDKISLSKKIKDSVKGAVSFISDFEETAIDIALENNYDFVVCGHIHQPVIKEIKKEGKKVTYLNSGDWIENLTALEFHKNKWSIYRYDEKEFISEKEITEEDLDVKSTKELFNELITEFNIK